MRVGGLVPGGVRATVTESWGQLDFDLTNPTDVDRRIRVVAFYVGAPDAQFGRELWVPARATLNSWMVMGPAPAQGSATSRDIEFLLHDLTDGQENLLLPPTEERVRTRGVLYHPREPWTALAVEIDQSEHVPGQLPQREPFADEAIDLVRAFRQIRGLPNFVQLVDPSSLPSWDKVLDGIDHLVLASNRVAECPGGLQAVRHWLQHGGNVWVLLDKVGPEVIVSLLGEAFDFTVVDKVSLTEFRVDASGARPGGPKGALQQYEEPVEFVHVQLPPGEVVQSTVQGWPAWFTRDVGRGKVLFTTLGPRGWYTRRPQKDGKAWAVATDTLGPAAAELKTLAADAAPPVNAFEGLLTQEIGYSVLSRSAVGILFTLFLAGTLVLGLGVRRAGKAEFQGWLGPAAALATSAAFLLFGAEARRAAPPTAAMAQVIDAVSGTGEAAVEGLLALYRPESGPLTLGAGHEAFLGLDLAGLEGKTRRFLMTDAGTWHWENLAVPAGVRLAPFRFTANLGEPIRAVATLGPDGIAGKIAAGPVQGLTDGVLCPPLGRNLALHLEPDRTFTARPDDVLASGQFLAGAVLSDEQQQRQQLYRRLVKQAEAASLRQHPVVLAWANLLAAPFTLPVETRIKGTALVMVPLRLKAPAPGTRVTIPGPLISHRRLIADKWTRTTRESSKEADLHVRFQVPAEVLPFKVEAARLTAKIAARSRSIAVAGWVDGRQVEVYRTENPLGPINVTLTDPAMVNLDASGGLHVHLAIKDLHKRPANERGADPDLNWTIEYLELTVTGRTGP